MELCLSYMASWGTMLALQMGSANKPGPLISAGLNTLTDVHARLPALAGLEFGSRVVSKLHCFGGQKQTSGYTGIK